MMIGNIATGNVAIRFNAKVLHCYECLRNRYKLNRRGFHAVKDGYVDAVIAGGTEAVISPLTIRFPEHQGSFDKSRPEEGFTSV